MAWDLRGNYDDELDRAAAFSTIGDVARVDELFPAYPQDLNLPILTAADLPSTVTRRPRRRPPLDLDERRPPARDGVSARAALDAVPHLVGDGEGVGSNSWVVSGDLTESGKPLLANDPHLGISAPGVWEQVGLRCATVSRAVPVRRRPASRSRACPAWSSATTRSSRGA